MGREGSGSVKGLGGDREGREEEGDVVGIVGSGGGLSGDLSVNLKSDDEVEAS